MFLSLPVKARIHSRYHLETAMKQLWLMISQLHTVETIWGKLLECLRNL